QLNAACTVPGTFSYTPSNGVVLGVGSQTLSALFVPNDTVHYATTNATVGLTVSPAQLSVTAANATRPYGLPNPAFAGSAVGLQNGDNITATYSCSATTNSPAG